MTLEPQSNILDFAETLQFFGPKILMAIFCGGLIGLERELKNKAAGIKTNMLICVGSALFTATSIMIETPGHPGDPARIAAQIVSGIGFLGGGAILQSKETIIGLTTAATIWTCAAVGVFLGMGQLIVGGSITVVIVSMLISVTFIENRFLGRKRLFKIVIHLRAKTDEVTRSGLEALFIQNELSISEYRETDQGPQPEIRIYYHGRMRDHSKMVLELWKIPGVLDVRQS